MIRTILLLVLSLGFLQADLTKEQIDNLHAPLVREQNGTLIIEEYYKVFLKTEMDVPFDTKKHKVVFQKSAAYMKKGSINKERFIALYSSISDELTMEFFAPLLQFRAIDKVETLIKEPIKSDVTFVINVTDKGVETTIKSGAHSDKKFIPFEKFFLLQMP